MTALIFKSEPYYLVVIMRGDKVDRIVKLTLDSEEADRVKLAVNLCLNLNLFDICD